MRTAVCTASEWRAILQAASQVNDWRGALRLLVVLKTRLGPDSLAYGHAIAALTRSSELDKALELLRELRRAGLKPELRSYNMAITCAGRSGKPEVTPP